ncbi:MAG: S8 family serine peptidase [Bacteroidia bacterium]|nr:S8 family serine peptidase [Bacteroidia bacterium]
MNVRQYILLAALLVLTACGDEPSTPISEAEAPSQRSAVLDDNESTIDVRDRYVVVFKESVRDVDRAVDEMTRGNGATVHFRYRHALKGFNATIPPQAVEALKKNPNVDYIEPDGIARKTQQSNPPSWGLDRIDQRNLPLNQTYNYQNNGSGVRVYILDTGIRFNHQEYNGRAFSGWDFIQNDPDASDCDGHGTHVAGTVGGTSVGVAKGVTLIAVRVLDCNGSGSWGQVIAGIDWVTANHIKPAVANMSLGGGYYAPINTAVANSIAAGVVYAVSAGNSNANACNYSPASTPAALTIGSTTSGDVRSSFSNYGSCVDIFAPGSSIYSSTMTSTSSYQSSSGTSMASPHVAGVAALYLSAHPTATPAQVETAIKSNATTGVLSSIGSGSPNSLLYSLIAAPAGPVPNAPSNLTVGSPTTSSLTLNWSDNSSDETGFRIERASSSNGPWSFVANVGQNQTSYQNTGLASSTTYWYRVFAFNANGNSSASNTASGTTASPPPPPNPPSNLVVVSPTSSSLTLNWSDNSGDESGFRIERASSSNGPWSFVANVGQNVTNYQNTGLASSTTYWYRVFAFNANGTSAASNTASGTTASAPTVAVHVDGLSGSTSSNKGGWNASLTVTVKNANGVPTQGVTVSVSWGNGSGSAVTNSSGQATITTGRNKNNVSSVTMSVTNLSGTGFTYDSAANNPNPPSLIINKP